MVTKSISILGRELVRVERDRAGNFSYQWLDGGNDFVNSEKYLEQSLNNPVLLTVLFYRSRLFSQMMIGHLDENDREVKNSEVLKLLKQPNYFQTQEDWLFQQEWFKSVAGTNFIYTAKAFANELPKALFNLVPSEIDLNNAHKIDRFLFTKAEQKALGERKIFYTMDNRKFEIMLKDLIPVYDMGNGMTNNSLFTSPSRVKGLSRVIQNIDANLNSKYKNLQMSAKYLSKNEGDGYNGQIQDPDRKAIEGVFSRKDLLVTNAKISIQHAVSDMKRLFLDEQFADDANKILLAFEMNKNVINYFAKDSTFENQSEGVISYISNSTQTSADALMNSLSQSFGLFEKGERLVAKYDHLPVMQPAVNKKVESFKVVQETIKLGLENGTLTPQEAKQMSDEFRLKLGL